MSEMRERLQKESKARMDISSNGDSDRNETKSPNGSNNNESTEELTKRYLNQAKQKMGDRSRTMSDVHQARENELNRKESEILERENQLLKLEEDIITKLLLQQDQLVSNLDRLRSEYNQMKSEGTTTKALLQEKAKALKEMEKEADLRKAVVDKEVQERRSSITAIKQRRKSSATISRAELEKIEKKTKRRHSQLIDYDAKVIDDVNDNTLFME